MPIAVALITFIFRKLTGRPYTSVDLDSRPSDFSRGLNHHDDIAAASPYCFLITERGHHYHRLCTRSRCYRCMIRSRICRHKGNWPSWYHSTNEGRLQKGQGKKKLLPSIRQIASRLRKLKKTGIYDITTTSGLMAFAHTRMMENFDMSKLSEDELASWGGGF